MPSIHSLRAVLLASAVAAAAPAIAAEVTPARLANPEPGNWLMNHRTYDAQRYSPLDQINTANVKGLKLAYAVAIGGTCGHENLESTPLAEDGFLYVVDQWGVVYKIDARSGDAGRIVWRMDPGQEKAPDANRGAALWGNFVISVANYPPRRDRDRQGDRQGRLGDQPVRRPERPAAHRGAAGREGQDHRRRRPAATAACATSSLGARCRDRQAAVAKIRRFRRPASPARKPGRTRTTPGGPAAAPCGSPAPTIPPPTRCCGAPAIRCRWSDPYYRPGDNLYTNSLISWDPDSGKMNWYHQYTPGDMWDYDEEGSHILIDGQVGGEPRKVVTHPARNGFLYAFERTNGQTAAGQALYAKRSTGPSGIDQKTGKPVDYDPNRDIQVYSGRQNMTPDGPHQAAVPVA